MYSSPSFTPSMSSSAASGGSASLAALRAGRNEDNLLATAVSVMSAIDLAIIQGCVAHAQ